MALTKVSSGLISADASSVDLNIDAGTLYIDATNNRVGIGTTSPSRLLEVSSNASDVPQIRAAYNATNYLDIKHNVLNAVSSGGNDALIIQTASTERARFDVSSNLLVGKTSSTGVATTNIEVSNASSAAVQIEGGTHEWSMLVSSSADALRFYEDSTEHMRIDTSGNLGIGTTSPSGGAVGGKVLHLVNSGGTASVRVDRSDSSTSGTISLLDSNSTHGLYGTGSKPMAFSTNSTERMRISSSGNVGIGNTQARYPLNVYNSTNDTETLKLDINGGDGSVQGKNHLGINHFGSDTTHSSCRISAIENSTANWKAALTFSTRGVDSDSAPTERMRIDSGGNLLVGTTSLRTGLAEAHYFVGSSSSSGSAPFTVYNDSGTANTPALNVLNRDDSTDSTNRFVQFWANVTSSTAQAMGGIVGNGATNVQFATLSDEREKENITPVNNVLDRVMNLNVVSFDWKFNDEHVKAGFIAQNVEEHFPEYVIENVSLEGEEPRKGTSGGMSAGYIAVLTKAIQEQQEQIESLKSRIETLEANNG